MTKSDRQPQQDRGRGQDDERPDNDERPGKATPKRAPSRAGWLLSRLAVMLVLLAVLGFFAPTIIATTGLWKPILAAAAPKIADKVHVGALSLGWLSPIQLRNVRVLEADGQLLAEAALVRSQKTLLELAGDATNLGTFEVTDPRANIVLRSGGSNIEDFLAKLPKDDEKKNKPDAPVQFGLVVTRGSVQLDDQIAGRKWSLDNLNLEFAWPAAAGEAKTGKLSASIAPALGGVEVTQTSAAAGPGSPVSVVPAGAVLADFTWQPGEENDALGTGRASIRLSSVATESLEGALRRFAADIRPQGPVTLDASYSWSGKGKSQQVVVRELASPRLTIASPALLGTDVVSTTIASGQADVQLAGDKLAINQLRLDSTLIQAAGSGSAAIGSLTPTSLLGVPGAGDTTQIEVQGRINLAELARQLPTTLRMREGTQITSGSVQMSLTSRAEVGGRRWDGSLKTDQIQATALGRPIQFDQPLSISAIVRQTPQGPVIDELIGQASFLHLQGSGTLDEGLITADADLNRLVAELGRLIDWGDTRLAGMFGGQIQWRRGERDNWQAAAAARVQNFELAAAGLAPWKEQDLTVNANLNGQLIGTSLEQINSGKLTVIGAADRLEAELTGPVSLAATPTPSASQWPVKFALQGELATWLPRVQPFVALGEWRMAGAVNASGSGRFSAAGSELGPTTVRVEQLAIDGPSLSIREPVAKLDTAGAWDQAKATLTLPSTTFASSSIAFRADDIRFAASDRPTVTGLVDFRGDLGKLTSWLGSPDTPRGWQLAGALTGHVEVGYQGQTLSAAWTTDVEKLVYLTPLAPPAAGRAALASARDTKWEALWEEPRLTFAGQATYDPVAGKFQLSRSNLATSLLGCSAIGSVSDVTGLCLADLQGEINYDLADASQRLSQTLAGLDREKVDYDKLSDTGKLRRNLRSVVDELKLVGQEKRSFVLRGPLFPPPAPISPANPAAVVTGPLVSDQLTGEASLGWQSARYVGLLAGKADVRARIDHGIVHIGPVDIPISEGRLTTAPRLLLNAPERTLVVDRGPLVEQVRISPEMFHTWMMYIAPLVAQAAEAEGKFSLSLEGASVPLVNADRSNVAGTLQIHGAQVRPGPLTRQYIDMARQVQAIINAKAGEAQSGEASPLVVLPEQNVQFDVREGAVHHNGFTMTVKDVAITTQGSVRISDQTLNLVASIPIQENWFKKKDRESGLLSSLKGQSLKIPIRGTLTQPRPDARILQDFGKQVAGSAVQGLLDKGLEKGQGVLQDELGKGLNRLFGPRPQNPPK